MNWEALQQIAAGQHSMPPADANGNPTVRRSWTYDHKGRLLSVTDATAEAEAPAVRPDVTQPGDSTGPVVPAAGIGQGVRTDPPRPEPTPAEQLIASMRDSLDAIRARQS